jgi:large subunit ribosomal protein L20
MPRVKRGVTIRKRHKKLLALTKGYKHGRKNLVRHAKQAMIRAGQYAFRDRRVKKRTFRARWITKLNAAVRLHDMSYSQFIAASKKAGLELNRKVLSELAEFHPAEFEKVMEKVKAAR